MVDLQYVKKRKRKRIAAIVTACGSVVTAVFVIVAFLGNQVGTFTVNLKQNNVKLSLSDNSTFTEPTSYLRVRDIQRMDSYCYQSFKDLSGNLNFDKIDSELYTYEHFARTNPQTGEIIALPFFKYTFFVRNEGEVPARFTMNINILENLPDPTTKRTIDGLIRLIVIENGVPGKVYARPSTDSTHYDPETGEQTNLEYIDGDPTSEIYEGLAEPFVTQTLMQTITVTNFNVQEVTRYTILYWLEGHDYPEGYYEQPKDAKLKLGVEINAYEN